MLTSGQIVGIVAGAIVLLVIIGIVIYFIVRNSKSSGGNNNGNNNSIYSTESLSTEPTQGQTKPLRITNQCPYDIWVEIRCTRQNPNYVSTDPNNPWSSNPADWIAGAPLPGYQTPMFVPAGKYLDFDIPAYGLAGLACWAKKGCDASGQNCVIGDSSQIWGGWNNPAGGCPVNGCTPPIDTLFEASFGCSLTNQSMCSPNPSNLSQKIGNTNYMDISGVDGYTFGYMLYVKGNIGSCSCPGDCNLDGSKLSLSQCPIENLSLGGEYNSINGVDMTSIDLNYYDKNGKSVGCFSPCKKLTFSPPSGLNQELSGSNISVPASVYCCPTPVSEVCTSGVCQDGSDCINGYCSGCTLQTGCATPGTCRIGINGQSAANSLYVTRMNDMAPNVYSWQYDDSSALSTCTAGQVMYEIQFLPA